MAIVDSRIVGQTRSTKVLYALVRGLVVGICRSYLRLRVIGLENIPKQGPFVFAPTHRSTIDIPVASAATRRRMRFMGKDTIWKYKPLGKFMTGLGAFPVTRGSADLEALKRCIAILNSGEPLVMFPEGTRHFGPEVQPLFDGAAYVALKTGVSIVPAAIAGTEDVMRSGSKAIRFKKCRMVIGKPITAEVPGGGRASREQIAELTLKLQQEMQLLLDEANRLIS
jgi:1-acyl-sn-glycerol-3-phosphate acyltransferase